MAAMHRSNACIWECDPQIESTYEYRSRNWGSVSALPAGAYTTTLYMMVDTV